VYKHLTYCQLGTLNAAAWSACPGSAACTDEAQASINAKMAMEIKYVAIRNLLMAAPPHFNNLKSKNNQH
jgi:hypothetical protein